MIFNEYLNLNSFLIFNWTDLLEILVFSLLIYYCSLLLKSDKQKNLLGIFYSLFSILILSSFAQMPTISNFFISFLPVTLVILFLVHQKTLQKNFVSLKKISSTKNFVNNDWIDDFMRSCFNAMSNNKQITCIIEGNNSLTEFIKIPFIISASLNKELTDILINSQTFDQQKMIWITWDGKIQAINGIWCIKNYDLWFSQDTQSIDDWQKDAIIFTSKIDCILFRTYPAKRTLDIIIQGRLIEDISPNNALNLITQFIKKNEIKTLKKDWDSNEVKSKNSWYKQPNA